MGYDPPAGNGTWQTVGEQDFDRRVLKGKLPGLVYFDAANGCHGADGVFTSLSAQRKGILTVFRVDIAAHPQLARAYDVEDDVVFVLFANGRTVKNGGLYSDERFLAEMEPSWTRDRLRTLPGHTKGGGSHRPLLCSGENGGLDGT